MLIQPLSMFAPGRIREARAAAEPFRVPGQGASRPGGPASTAALTSLQTLLAVQEVTPGREEQRRRAVRRGEELLTELGRLQLAMLGDGDAILCLERLHLVLADQPGLPDDEDLDRILAEIELRAAVEIAKRERAG
jgi:Class II flagellar assembly regulator